MQQATREPSAHDDSSESHLCGQGLERGFRKIGAIERLQLQTGRIKTGRPGTRTYDPAPLRTVDSLIATRWGLAGSVTDSTSTLDSHHRVRRSSRHWYADRVFSFGFTSHYDSLRTRFPSLALGTAGENVIVGTSEIISFSMIAGGIHVCGSTGPIDVWLVQPLDPCAPFARYLGDGELPGPQVQVLMAELGEGMRGFSGRLRGDTPAELRVGAEVWVKSGRVLAVRRSIKRSVIRPLRRRARRLVKSSSRVSENAVTGGTPRVL